MGFLFQIKAEKLVNGKERVEDPIAVAQTCFAAAYIYIGFFLFCLGQSWIHSKKNSLNTYSGINQ
jgi:hypothetical protein